ncbi:putative peptidase (DUF1758) [Popillia japonica]|uniref:Peptidase (DUF1758) n=1 Tax=Popillia japonica TaxID=7064 RepID=A0AAW1HV08_POPJA
MPNTYNKHGVILPQILSANTNSLSVEQSIAMPNTYNKHGVILPQIHLPEFSGSYETWFNFHDLFLSLIHNSKTLSNIQKYQYLKVALKGEAAQVIESLPVSDKNYNTAWELLKNRLPVSDKNYNTAWELLKNRYANKKVIIKGHLKAIFELPIVHSSPTAIRQFTDNFQKHFRALQNLDLAVESWDAILIFLLTSKLDTNSKREWENQTSEADHPTIEEFIQFLNKRCRILEQLDSKQTGSSIPKKVEYKTHAHASTTVSCFYCNDAHYIFYCKKFLSLNTSERLSEGLQDLNLCINCLRKGHNANKCKSRGCKTCSKRHNSILHFISDEEPIAAAEQTQTNALANYCTHTLNTFSLLSTAIIHIFDSRNVPIKARCLLDSGSQSNFITQDLVRKLNLNPIKISMPVRGINSAVTQISSKAAAKIGSLYNDYTQNLEFLIINKITDDVPQFNISTSSWQIPQNIQLADTSFFKSNPIDILLGVGIFYDLLKEGQIKLGANQPTLQNSVLGWIVSSPLVQPPNLTSYCNLTNIDIQNQIERFWIIEQGSVIKPYTKEERECEQNFITTFSRDTLTGRFSSESYQNLPFRDNYNQLGNSRTIAENRFLSLERKLSKNSELKNEYCSFMEEYQRLGHMSKINPNLKSKAVFYLPHHCVQKHTSLTTKLRVVFDGSCKSDSGLSLNDVLKVGPTIQEDLYSILLRFRLHNIVITADIEKMYRQVDVTPEHRDVQRIVWRADPNKELEHFTLNTVTYAFPNFPIFRDKIRLQLSPITHRKTCFQINQTLIELFPELNNVEGYDEESYGNASYDPSYNYEMYTNDNQDTDYPYMYPAEYTDEQNDNECSSVYATENIDNILIIHICTLQNIPMNKTIMNAHPYMLQKISTITPSTLYVPCRIYR